MKNILMTTDLHLTDIPTESYRWDIFGKLEDLAIEHVVDAILILGDMTDRKDRHSGGFVNRLVDSLTKLQSRTSTSVNILLGNHDQPLTGVPYLDFFNKFRDIHYVTYPVYVGEVGWLLPFTSDPITSWKDLKLNTGPAIYMHQTVEGSMVERDHVLSAPHKMPLLPRGVPIFSGDVHRPQKVGVVTYIGVPHPVDFGENWDTRVLLIEEGDFKNPKELAVDSIKRVILDIYDLPGLEMALAPPFGRGLRKGDQVRIRFHFPASDIADLPIVEEKIGSWASRNGIEVASIENILEEELKTTIEESGTMEMLKPADVIRSFGADRKLDKDLLEYGISIYNSAS